MPQQLGSQRAEHAGACRALCAHCLHPMCFAHLKPGARAHTPCHISVLSRKSEPPCRTPLDNMCRCGAFLTSVAALRNSAATARCCGEGHCSLWHGAIVLAPISVY